MIDEGTKTWALCSFPNRTVGKWQILFPNVSVSDSKISSCPQPHFITNALVHYDGIQEYGYSKEYKAGFNLSKNVLDE